MVAVRDNAGERVESWWHKLQRTFAWLVRTVTAAFGDLLPKGLYARALIIIIAPIVLLESVVAISRRLSASIANTRIGTITRASSSWRKR